MSNLAAVISSRFHDLQKSSQGASYAMVKIKVHMATCGIAAGAREVMKALQDDILAANRPDIQVEIAGCIGKCSTEPNITVEIEGEDPVVYQLMNAEKTHEVFHNFEFKKNKNKIIMKYFSNNNDNIGRHIYFTYIINHKEVDLINCNNKKTIFSRKDCSIDFNSINKENKLEYEIILGE